MSINIDEPKFDTERTKSNRNLNDKNNG